LQRRQRRRPTDLPKTQITYIDILSDPVIDEPDILSS
jgi:hypothetical protein